MCVSVGKYFHGMNRWYDIHNLVCHTLCLEATGMCEIVSGRATPSCLA